MIQSNPNGAKLYVDGEVVGTTPYTHRDTKIVGSVTSVRLEKEGYAQFNTSFARNEEADIGAIIGGLFVWVPFLWIMKYKPTHTYELSPLVENPVYERRTTNQPQVDKPKVEKKSKVDRLREFKQLMDEGIITQDEFDKEKKKVLDED